MFWKVGSSATLGTTTLFTGDILAQASVTLNTGADITCGAAWARTGAVTLDTNTISICTLLAGPGGTPLGPTGVPLFAFLLPSSASADQRAVANALDAFVAGGGTLPLAFLNLFNLSPSQLASAFTQLSGETATGAATGRNSGNELVPVTCGYSIRQSRGYSKSARSGATRLQGVAL